MNTAHTASASAPTIDAERLVSAVAPTAADRLLRITPLTDRAGLRIEGELDRATMPAWGRALASMASGGREFCVDLSGLAFIDVGCLRALVGAAAELHDGDIDHVLTLRSAPSQVRRLLELTGWDQTPGLHLQAPDPLISDSPGGAPA